MTRYPAQRTTADLRDLRRPVPPAPQPVAVYPTFPAFLAAHGYWLGDFNAARVMHLQLPVTRSGCHVDRIIERRRGTGES